MRLRSRREAWDIFKEKQRAHAIKWFIKPCLIILLFAWIFELIKFLTNWH